MPAGPRSAHCLLAAWLWVPWTGCGHGVKPRVRSQFHRMTLLPGWCHLVYCEPNILSRVGGGLLIPGTPGGAGQASLSPPLGPSPLSAGRSPSVGCRMRGWGGAVLGCWGADSLRHLCGLRASLPVAPCRGPGRAAPPEDHSCILGELPVPARAGTVYGGMSWKRSGVRPGWPCRVDPSPGLG